MGNSRSKHCVKDDPPSIMPVEDPLTQKLSQAIVSRIVRTDISRDFEMTSEVLGAGFSGAVLLARHRQSMLKVAVKKFTKRRLQGRKMDLLKSEVEVYLRLDHPNVCRLLYAYESNKDVWLVMELCSCELYARVCERKAYKERDAADVLLQMLQAVNYLHSRNIVHRDLKLENWMYGESAASGGGSCSSTSLGREDRVKLIDFGFSRIISGAEEKLELPCGTLYYTSPQVLMRNYTSKCDIWSLGVITYMLLMGRPPFCGDTNRVITKAIMSGDFPKDHLWRLLSRNAREFISSLLTTDANKRPTAGEALLHPWLADAGSSGSLSGSGEIGTDVLRNLRKFACSSHLRRAALLVMAYSLTSKELQDVEQSFLALDKDRTGVVTLINVAEVLREYLGEEVTSSEISRILGSLDVANDEGVHYTSFVAAMLAARVQIHEDKVRAAFEAFDKSGSGFITAESLVSMFSGSDEGMSSFTKEDAQTWINQVDYKRNGVIDYDGFFQALTGKIVPDSALLAEADDDVPIVRVFEDVGLTPRARGMSESYAKSVAHRTVARKFSMELAAAIIDEDERRRPGTFSGAVDTADKEVHVRNTTCRIDEQYFADRSSPSGLSLKAVQ
mmetsp:Transcript_35986/g.81248  ORF Transcript_35986/g.81248 Transcript_35986/m.81248 type:complete len:616 (-) Transcript_35986:57-1904(-)